MNPLADFKNQRGQAAISIAVMVMILLAMLYSAVKEYRRIRLDYDKSQYKEWAIEAARGGFNDSQAYFRDNYSTLLAGTSHLAPNALTNGTWEDYPDGYFMAGSNSSAYTDNYNLLTATTTFNGSTSTVLARGLMRSYPFNMTSSAEVSTPRLWVNYVLKRQNIRNWSPHGNTCSVNTDPEAVHDVSDARVSGTSGGTGNTWGITCRAYIYSWPYANPMTSSACYVGGDILGSPRAFLFPGNKIPLLIATAKVYGEITALAINIPNTGAPVTVNNGATVTVSGSHAIIDGGSTAPVCSTDAVKGTPSGGGTLNPNVALSSSPYTSISFSTIFPGASLTDLSHLADKVGGISQFPDPTLKGTTGYETAVSTKTFYVINSSADFSQLPARAMVGVGLVVINGNLNIPDGNATDFAGIVFVNGNVTMSSGLISGCLIATGYVHIVGGTTTNTGLSGNSTLVGNVKNIITNYRVNKASILTN